MNIQAFLSGYMHKESMQTATIEGFVPPTEDPSPQTDKNVNAVQEAEKEKTLDMATATRMESEEGI